MSDNLTISVDEASLQKTVERLSKYDSNVQKGAKKQVLRSSLSIQAGARMRVPIATNRLRSSIKVIFGRGGLGASIGTNVRYAGALEDADGDGYGRVPGRPPPVSAILPWVHMKITRNAKLAKGIAFLIARKIGMFGTLPQPFLLPAAKNEWPRYKRAIRQLLKIS